MISSIALFELSFYFLRHGETESNVREIIAGSTDVPLTKRGITQARVAAEALKPIRITGIYSSPLIRARDTAEPIGKTLGLSVTIIEELAERSWGDLEGKPRGTRVRGETPAGGETWEEYLRRVLQGLARIDDDAPLIVAHSGVFRVLCRTLGIDESGGPVANAWPLRFAVPKGDAAAWRVEPI